MLSSVAAGVVVLDSDLLVRSWNKGAEELWGLRADEVRQQPFFNLVFGLPTGEVRDLVHQCLTSGRRAGTIQVAAVNRIGRSITCTVTCSNTGDGEGAVLLMEELYQEERRRWRAAARRAAARRAFAEGVPVAERG